MKTKLLTIEQWNMIPKDEETQVDAVEGDTALLINGVAFLIQRKNNWNNVVCIRLKPSKINIVQTFETFRAFCQKNDIQYFRVEELATPTECYILSAAWVGRMARIVM